MKKDDKSVSMAKSSKPAGKNGKFSVHRMVAEMEAKKLAEEKYVNYVPNGAIHAPFDKKPNPDMLYDYNNQVWIPKSSLKKRRELIEMETQRIVDSMPDPGNPGYTFGGDKIKAEKTTPKVETSEQQEQQSTGTPVVPKDSALKEKKTEVKPQSPNTSLEVIKADSPPPVEAKSNLKPIVSQVQTEPAIEPQSESVEQSKKTRQSAKMVASDFDTLAAQFICPTDLGEKKPLFFPEKIRESLRKIAGLVPGGKVSPSHIAIHIIEAWIDEHRDLFNRMFANQKTSI